MRNDSKAKKHFGTGILAITILAFWQSVGSAQVLRENCGPLTSGTSYASGRSIFGSPFANQPFSISGMTGGSLSGTYQSTFGSPYAGLRGTGVRNNFGYWNGNFGGPALVAPGWWGLGWGPGVGFWGPGIGLFPSAWWVGGWNTGFVGANPWGWGFGPGWGWNAGFFPPMWNNGFAWDWGFLGAMDNMVMMGNGRFGPARPVRQQRAARGNGIGIPANGGGLNAIAPNAPLQAAAQPNLMNFVRVTKPREATNIVKPEAPAPDRLQTADRLARNGLLDEALKRYATIAEKHPDDAAPLIRIAQIHALADRPGEAAKAFANAEKRATDQFSAVLKSTKWSDIADSVASTKLKANFENWSNNPEYSGIEKLKATFSSGDTPTIAQLP